MTILFSKLVYILGFVGLAAIPLIPLRAWHFLRAHFGRDTSGSAKISRVLVALLFGAALVADVRIIARMFHCLTGAYCGPTVAHGWILLAMLGVVYLVLEALVTVISAMSRLASGGAMRS